MHRIFYSLLIAAILIVSVPANSATVNYDGSGNLVGISGLSVGSDQYDVSFIVDSFDNIWPNPAIPTFWGSEEGYSAAAAIVDVFDSNNISVIYYDRPTTEAYWYQFLVPFADVLTPNGLKVEHHYGMSSGQTGDPSSFIGNWYPGPPGNLPGSNWRTFSSHTHMYATFSAVPIPGAVWLLGSGLIGIVGIRRKFKE